MEEWKKYKIGDLCSISSSKRIFAKEYQSSGVPFFRGKEIIEKQKGESISTELYISRSRYDEIKIKYGVPKEGDMLLTSVGTLGIPYIVKNEIFYFKDGNLTWFSDFKGLNSKFLYYWFLSPIAKNAIEAKAIGSTQKALTIDSLSKFEINIPDIDTQNRIASVLSFIDDKIELNRRINDNLEQQAQALFKSWFVNFEPFKNGQFVDSELGKIPKGWKVGYLSEIADIIMGQSPNGSTYNENGEGIIFYQGRAEFGTRFPSIRLFTTNPTRIAPANSILISVRAPVGDINITHKECCIGRGLASAVSRTNKSAFLLYTLFSLKSDLDRFNAEGTVFGSINRKALETLKILIPTNDIISKFEAIVASMDQQILTLHLESENLKILRDTLLPKLMSGERSVIHKENNDD